MCDCVDVRWLLNAVKAGVMLTRWRARLTLVNMFSIHDTYV